MLACRNGAIIGLCLLLPFASLSCNRTEEPLQERQSVEQDASATDPTAVADGASWGDKAEEAASKRPRTQLDDEAVNEEGLIILQGDSPPRAAPESGVTVDEGGSADFQLDEEPSDTDDQIVIGADDDETAAETDPVVSLATPEDSADSSRSEEKISAVELEAMPEDERTVTDDRSAEDESQGTRSTANILAASGTPTIAAPADRAEPASAPNANSSGKSPSDELPPEANVTSDDERKQVIAPDWPEPQVVLYVSGQQHGYLEPCGCTGLENQKGGLIRRDTLLASLRARGWQLVPLDVGNQVRRVGRQPELKFQTTVDAFNLMNYRATTFGIDDLKLSSVELVQLASNIDADANTFLSSNVTVLDPSFFPDTRVIEAGGRKIGVTGALSLELAKQLRSSDIEVTDPLETLPESIDKLQEAGCDFIVLLAHASLDDSARYAQEVAGIDLVVTAGGFGEPTLNPEPIEGSSAVMVQVGVKGMYGGIVGLFDDSEPPMRYQKIAISSQFEDSERMLDEFAVYQQRLKEAGFDGLGAKPVAHPTGREFIGSETCGDCHTTAYDIWEDTPHFHATESIVHPPNDRGGVQRHFDPECVSCHVTGWNPQAYYPYLSGYQSLEKSEHLFSNGCENCHGPGAKHAAAEYGDIEASTELLEQLREQMKLPLAEARDKCLECHDLDNSPDFHTSGAFDEYWEQVKHYGKN